jgi:hypothetical protein
LDINIGGVFLFCKYGIPMLIERGGGVIINTASIAALRGGADAHAYTATKGAIVSLTRAIAVTYGSKGIRANTICPGVIDTEMIHDTLIARNNINTILTKNTPLRAGTAEDIADVALFLASDASRFITGEEIIVDGGISTGVILHKATRISPSRGEELLWTTDDAQCLQDLSARAAHLKRVSYKWRWRSRTPRRSPRRSGAEVCQIAAISALTKDDYICTVTAVWRT